MNNKGQSTIETLVVLPPLITLITGFLFGAYIVLTLQWCDYWIYRSNICLVQGIGVSRCQKQLEQKLKLLVPSGHFSIEEIWISPKKSKISARFVFGSLFQKKISSVIHLPIQSHY